MSPRIILRLGALSLLLTAWHTPASDAQTPTPPGAPPEAAVSAAAPMSLPPPTTAPSPVALEFMAAMQRIRQHVAEPADSPALDAYVIHDYLVAARLRRDVEATPGEDLDATIDGFLKSHAGQPVTRALRHDWLASLAARGRWDWFLPRSIDATDAQLACDRLAGRLATGDTEGLGRDALARWVLPQRQPDECTPIFTWLHAQGLITPELADTRTRGALTADNPRLARDFVADVPAPRSAPLLQWIQLLDSPKATITTLAGTPATAVEPDALVAGFSRFSISDTNAASAALPSLLLRPDMTPALRTRLQRAAALVPSFALGMATAPLAVHGAALVEVLALRQRQSFVDLLPPAIA